MSECQMIHETVVRDIVDLIDAAKDVDKSVWLNTRNRTGSIAKRAANLVLVFPVIASSNLSFQTAFIISKAIERKCVSLLQLLFSSIQYQKGIENVEDFIKLFHTNLRGLNLDDFMSLMDGLVNNEEAITVTDKDTYDMVMEDMRNINYYLSTDYGHYASINEYKIRKDACNQYQVLKEAGRGKSNITVDPPVPDPANNPPQDPFDNDDEEDKKKKRGPKILSQKDQVDLIRYQLIPQDVQKANELAPTLMEVNFNVVPKDGDGATIPMTGIVGIKAKLYPVDSMEIINRISSKVTEKNGLFNLVRASTREISFFKDLALAIDKSKADAITMANNSSNAKIFKLLERRAAKHRFTTLLRKNDASPITSLIMTQDEVEYLKKYCNIDMTKDYATRSVLEHYNLMDIVIADESLELAKFLYDDGDGAFEIVPFDSLEKEAKDNSYKKMVNLMSKMR